MVDNNVFSKKDLHFLLKLKARELSTDDVQITAKQLQEYFLEVKWRNIDNLPLYTLIDHIESLDFSTIYDYLSVKVIKEARNLTISDFDELISR
ncbi:MAG: post-transcriptional regulator [Erysipelotrichaceae bacterium]|nr:post-transcriptional regulator [Erysipelotrichaceae bacterium]